MRQAIILIIIYFSAANASSQTCCSGGVPIAGNVGFTNSIPQSFQVELSYDYNLLKTLKFEDQELDDDSRTRVTQSILLKTGYTFSNGVSIEGLFTYVQQIRAISQFDNVNVDETHGVGDAVLLVKYSRYINSFLINVGTGPKIPLGKHNLSNEIGIPYNADLQPGSGSWDALGWVNVSNSFRFRPTLTYFSSLTMRLNGKNKSYLETEEYQFGNSIYGIAGISDRFAINRFMMDPGISFSYRRAYKDKINNNEIENTGGRWVFLNPSLSISWWQNVAFNFAAELPVYAKVSGTQLSPTLRLRAGIYYIFTKKQKLDINPEAL
jgi:hypothetical protein